jgi:hypothetical protein
MSTRFARRVYEVILLFGDRTNETQTRCDDNEEARLSDIAVRLCT